MVVYCFVHRWRRPILRQSCRRRHGVGAEECPEQEPSPRILARLDTPSRRCRADLRLSRLWHGEGVAGQNSPPARRLLQRCAGGWDGLGGAVASSLPGSKRAAFHIWCDSTFGKTAAITVGESFYGRPSTTSRPQRRSVRLEVGHRVRCRASSDWRRSAPIFRSSSMKSDQPEASRRKLVETIYVLTGGTPKLRADSQGNIREQQGFSTLVFTTGEIPLRTFLDKMDDTEGRKKRLVDVPALVGVDDRARDGPAREAGRCLRPHLHRDRPPARRGRTGMAAPPCRSRRGADQRRSSTNIVRHGSHCRTSPSSCTATRETTA